METFFAYESIRHCPWRATALLGLGRPISLKIEVSAFQSYNVQEAHGSVCRFVPLSVQWTVRLTEQSTDRLTDRSADWSTVRSTDRLTVLSSDRSTCSVDRTIDRSVDQSVDLSVGRSVDLGRPID